MKHILRIRLHQIRHYAQELGSFRLMIAIALMLFVGAKLIPLLLQKDFLWFLPIIWFWVLAGMHVVRNDIPFLKKVGLDVRKVMAVEYALLSIPFVCLLMLLGHWLEALLSVFSVGIIIWLPTFNWGFGYKWGGAHFVQSIFRFPQEMYEWRVWLQSNALTLVLYWIFLWASWFHPLAFAGLAILLPVSLTTMFQDCENLPFIEEARQSPRVFLVNKMKKALRCIFLFLLPFLASWWVFPQYGLLYVYALYASMALTVLAIVYKYSMYEPGAWVSNRMLLPLWILFLLVPFMAPISIFLIVKYFRRAVSNLNQLLYAFGE